MRTYSRIDRKLTSGGEPPAKRRRISSGTLPHSATEIASPRIDIDSKVSHPIPSSSPAHRIQDVSSDSVEPASTPPSSPPAATTPISAINTTEDDQHTRLCETTAITKAPPMPSLAEMSANRPKQTRAKQSRLLKLTQLHLDFGQKIRQRCKTCGMEYAPSIAEDAAVHKQFHNMNVGGIELGRPFVESEVCRSRSVWQGSNSDRIIECTCRDEKSLKNKTRTVLDVVDTELGAIKITDEQLWPKTERDSQTVQFKAYLFLRGSRCVGFCLVEDLAEAYKVLGEEESDAKGAVHHLHRKSLRTADQPEAMMRGIARVWVSQNCRREGLAIKLLDCVQHHAIYGRIVPKRRIAFSQPTAHGVALARKWYGENAGWHVYAG